VTHIKDTRFVSFFFESKFVRNLRQVYKENLAQKLKYQALINGNTTGMFLGQYMTSIACLTT